LVLLKERFNCVRESESSTDRVVAEHAHEEVMCGEVPKVSRAELLDRALLDGLPSPWCWYARRNGIVLLSQAVMLAMTIPLDISLVFEVWLIAQLSIFSYLK
jgi:hypothetical protein